MAAPGGRTSGAQVLTLNGGNQTCFLVPCLQRIDALPQGGYGDLRAATTYGRAIMGRPSLPKRLQAGAMRIRVPEGLSGVYGTIRAADGVASASFWP